MSAETQVLVTPYLEFIGDVTPDQIEEDIFFPAIQMFDMQPKQIWPYNLASDYQFALDEDNFVVDLDHLDFQGVGYELNRIQNLHRDFFNRCYNELGQCRLRYGVVWTCL